MKNFFWASRDKPDRDRVVYLWWEKEPTKADLASAKMHGHTVLWDGNSDTSEIATRYAKRLGIDLKPGECKAYRIVEHTDD